MPHRNSLKVSRIHQSTLSIAEKGYELKAIGVNINVVDEKYLQRAFDRSKSKAFCT